MRPLRWSASTAARVAAALGCLRSRARPGVVLVVVMGWFSVVPANQGVENGPTLSAMNTAIVGEVTSGNKREFKSNRGVVAIPHGGHLSAISG